MSLPINDVPVYNIKLPSNGQSIRFRPFLVKEQKVLLMALESEDDVEIGNALINILESCLIDKINVRKLPIFDFEYLYLQMRAKSVGEVIKLRLKCDDQKDKFVDYELNLDDIKLDKPITKENVIKFKDNYGIVLKYPTIKSFSKAGTITDINLSLIKDSIESIFQGDSVFDTADVTEKELDEYVDNLTQQQFNKIIEHINSMPRLSHTIKYNNPDTGKEFTLKLEGMKDFF